jgi:hypothetical protein
MQVAGRQEFTIAEVARITDYHPDAVRYWVRVGELPGIQDQHRGEWIVDSHDLLSFLRGNGETVPEQIAGLT